jgi:hypothetical protein
VFRFEQYCPLHPRYKRIVFRTEVDSGIWLRDDWVTNMFSKDLKDLSSAYSSWCGTSVVLLLAIRRFHVPVPCSIIRESVADVRVRLNPGCEMDVRKELILAVEEAAVALEWIN